MTLSELWKLFKLRTDPQDLSEAERSFLHRFLSEEQKLREKNRIELLLRQSGIKRIKFLKEFDWTFNPKNPRDKLLEFLNTQWLSGVNYFFPSATIKIPGSPLSQCQILI